MIVHFDQDENQRSLAKSMRMDKATNPQNLSKKSLKEINLDLRRNLNFPNDEESSWEEVRKAGKAEEKHKTALKSPKMGSLG